MEVPNTAKLDLAAGEAAARAEAAAITVATDFVYRFRMNYPWLYAAIAFLIGAGLTGLIVTTTYRNWAFEGIDLETAFHHVIAGSIGGGIVMVILGFAYTRTIRPALGPMAAAKVTTPGG